MKPTAWATAGVLAGLLTFGAAPAAAAGLTTIAQYEMNERSGATTLVDSSGNGFDGTIGAHVGLDGSVHTFPFHHGWAGGTVDPAHNDLVANPALDPGTRDFSVALRLRFTQAIGNVLQKGQSGTAGGMYKLQLDDGDGRILCRYVSDTGSGGVWSPEPINDGKWHVVTCTRTASAVTITVDGTHTATINHSTGAVTSKLPLAIGGKSACKAVHGFDCDYFDGQIDWLRISSTPPADGRVITQGKVNWHDFYPYRRDGYRDRVRFTFRAGLTSALSGGADVTIDVWNAAYTKIVRTWTWHTDSVGMHRYTVRWAGRGTDHRRVRPGTYHVHAVIRASDAPALPVDVTHWQTLSARRGTSP